MRNSRIKEGDKVNIYWDNIQAEFNLTVLYTPCDVGDSWRLQREDGSIIFVILFGKMELYEQYGPNPRKECLVKGDK